MRQRLFVILLPVVFALPAIAAETPLSLLAPPGTLHGTLLSPNAKPSAPAILMLAGSGPTDRDGNSPVGLQANTYKLLADGLAASGITSLRVDKRGIAQSKDAMTAESDLRFETYVDDANGWAAELRKQTSTPCVWLLGHSEGALVAEVAAGKAGGICGLILISGAGRKAGDVLREQLENTLPEAEKQPVLDDVAALEAGRIVSDPPPQLAALFRPSVQPYLISWLALNPAEILAKSKLPVLIIQGDTDIQVSVNDAKILAATRPDAKLVILHNVNHVLKTADITRVSAIATYSNPELPLAPGVVDNIVQFLHEHGS